MQERYSKDFKVREAFFINALIKERITKKIFTEKFEDIQTALNNHTYSESDDTVNKYLNELYLKQNAPYYYQQMVDNMQSSVWPAVDVRMLLSIK